MLSPRKPYLIVSSIVFSVAAAAFSGTNVPSGATSERPAVKAAASDVQTTSTRGLRAWMKRRSESRKAKATVTKAQPRREREREGRPLGTPAALPLRPLAAGAAVGTHSNGARPVLSAPLRSVKPLPPPKRNEDGDGEPHREPIEPLDTRVSGGPDGVIQSAPGAVISAPTSTGVSWDGVGVGLAGFQPSSNPPDVNGHVGTTQYVQWNNTSFAVFNKTNGALLYGPAAGNTLFQSLGGVCASHNDGDPMVNFDILAGRWVLSQFAVDGPAGSASHQCFAVSLTDDATGPYYLYDFVTDGTNFVDYPHVGVWLDGYYMSTHVFNAAGTSTVAARVYVFERDKMLLGQTARMQSKDLPKDGSGFQYGFLPADIDSLTPPPAGAQEYVLGPNAQFTNRTDISRVATTWGVTPSMTLTSSVNTTVGVGTAPCVSNTAAQQNRDCVPQAGAGGGANVPADDLDNLGRHYLNHLAYQNHGGIESIIATGVTNGAVTTPAHGAIKWMEWRGAAGSAAPTLFQSGTYDPTPTQSDYRWMPSGAMDKDGNIAIGYSKSSNTTKPGIWMTGRLSTDTINTMGAETVVQAGGGVQGAGAGNRWGDYTAISLDPVDQCTFYYVNEYLKTDGAFNWSTRIASYKFPSCDATVETAKWGKINGTITSCATGAPLSGVVVTLSNGYAGVSDAFGKYSIVVPAGTYNATAAAVGDRTCNTASPATVSVIVPNNGGTTSQNFCMSGNSNLLLKNETVTDASGNGVVNKNECATVNVSLTNSGCSNETGISATLSTATAGVTVTQASSTYPNLAMDAVGGNNTAFRFQTSPSFVCGTSIAFTLTVNSSSGSKALNFSVPTCAGGANQSIPLSQLTTADTSQADRIGRVGVGSDCAGRASPGGGFAGTHYYKTFTFNNASGSAACFTVTINAALGGPGDIESVAYDQTYNPAAIDTNYLGDSGISGLGTTVGSASYSFTVPAGHNFVVVVNQTGTALSGANASSQFSGTVSGFVDQTAGPGACTSATAPASFVATAYRDPNTGNASNYLEWVNGAGSWTNTIIRRRTDTYPTSSTDGTAVSISILGTAGAKGSTVDSTGIVLGTTYYYAAFSTDGVTPSVPLYARVRPDSSAQVKWLYGTGASALTAPSILPGATGSGAAYTVSNDRYFHSFSNGVDTSAGAGLWPGVFAPLGMNRGSQARPPVLNTSVVPGSSRVSFISSQDGFVYAVDAQTGAQKWNSVQLGDGVQGSVAAMFAAFGGIRDILIAGSRTTSGTPAKNKLYGLNIANGTTVWAFDNSVAQGGDDNAIGIINGQPTVDYSTTNASSASKRPAFFASRQSTTGGSLNTLWAVEFDAGNTVTKKWAVNLGDIDGGPTLSGSTVYVGSNAGVVYARNASTGAAIWSTNLADGPVKGYIWVDSANNRLYCTTNGNVWAMNATTGTTIWNLPFTQPSPVLLAGGTLVFGASSPARTIQLTNISATLAANVVTHSLTLGDGSGTVGNPTLDTANSVVYVGSDSGAVYSVALPLP